MKQVENLQEFNWLFYNKLKKKHNFQGGTLLQALDKILYCIIYKFFKTYFLDKKIQGF